MPSVCRALAAILVVAAAMAAPAFAELVTLQPRPGVELRLGVEVRGGERAIALLFAGGHGKIQLDEKGKPHALRGNFLIRARGHLASRGIGIVLVDAPSDRQGERGLGGWRLTSGHAAEIGVAVRTIRQRFGKPIWLVGTSAGTASVAAAAAYLGGTDRPDGIVLTATITQGTPPAAGRRTRAIATVFDVSLGAYTGPAYVASHEGDACWATPAADAPRLLAALAGARPKQMRIFSGGMPPQSEPCEARSPHGFFGIEAEVMNAIADFILRPGG